MARSLSLPDQFEEQIQLLRKGSVRPIDLASVTYRGKGQLLHRRLWVNECQIGLGGEVVQKLRGRTKRLGGFLAFGLTALNTALRYPAHHLTIVLDDFRQIRRPVLGVVIGNGALTGGGMHLTPLAQPDDSYLDVLLIHSQNFLARLHNFPKIYRGTHIDCPDFSYFRARKIEITGAGEIPIAADGEFLGSLPATIEILPGALPVMTPSKGEKS
jgi:diacylglycerol kinase family enzyme